MKSFITTLCLLFSSLCLLQAQKSFGLEEAIQIAQNNAYTAKQQHYNVKNADAAYKELMAQRRPQLKLELIPSYKRYIADPTEDYLRMRNFDMLSAVTRLTLSQQVLPLGGEVYAQSQLIWSEYFNNSSEDGWRRQFASFPILVGYRHDLLGYNDYPWQKREAEHKQELEAQRWQSQKMQIAEETCRRFFALAVAQSAYNISQEVLKNSNFLYDMAQERYKIAMVTDMEVKTLCLRSKNDAYALAKSEKALKLAQQELTSYLHLSDTVSLALQLPEQLPIWDMDLETTRAQALSHHPSILDANLKLIKAQHASKKAKRESGANIGMDVSVGMNQIGNTVGESYTSEQFMGVGLVTLSVPLIDHGAARQHKLAAEAEVKSQEMSREEARRVVEEDVILTYTNLKEAQSQYQLKLEDFKLAREVYNRASKTYAQSVIDINTFSLAQTEYHKAWDNYIEVLMLYWTSYYHLQSLTLSKQ